MRRVDLVTTVPFWTASRGDASRIRGLVEFLAPRTSLRIVLLAKAGQDPAPVTRARIEIGQTKVALVGVRIDLTSHAQTLASLEGVFRESPASVALVEYVQLTWILAALPAGTRPFLDTHEIAHERDERFAAAGMPRPNAITEAAEYAAFSRYERIILIQHEDGDTVGRRIGTGRLLVAPHPARLLATEVRAKARHIGFVGSEYPPNVDGLRWFLDAVWPRIGDHAVELGIYGPVGRRIDPASLPSNARCHGEVADIDSAYLTFDIAINPVRVGAGLKIKTIEALGAGLPLVTTPEGARGLRDAAGEAFLLGRNEVEFAAHLSQLLASFAARERLAKGARRLAAERFSPEVCFGPLLRAIEET